MATRQEVEDRWLLKVKEARLRYQDATAKCRTILLEWHQGLTPSPDGAHAAIKAQQEEAAAFNEWSRVQQIFMNLVLRGKVPPEEE